MSPTQLLLFNQSAAVYQFYCCFCLFDADFNLSRSQLLFLYFIAVNLSKLLFSINPRIQLPSFFPENRIGPIEVHVTDFCYQFLTFYFPPNPRIGVFLVVNYLFAQSTINLRLLLPVRVYQFRDLSCSVRQIRGILCPLVISFQDMGLKR